MQTFVTKLKDAFSKPIVFFFGVALPYLITFILLAVFDCHIGLVISNILYWVLFFIHRYFHKEKERKQQKMLFYSELED